MEHNSDEDVYIEEDGNVSLYIDNKESSIDTKQIHKVMYIPKFRNYLHGRWLHHLEKKIYNELIDILHMYSSYYMDSTFLFYLDTNEFNKYIELIYFHILPKYRYHKILQCKENMEYVNKIYPLLQKDKKKNSNKTNNEKSEYNVWYSN